MYTGRSNPSNEMPLMILDVRQQHLLANRAMYRIASQTDVSAPPSPEDHPVQSPESSPGYGKGVNTTPEEERAAAMAHSLDNKLDIERAQQQAQSGRREMRIIVQTPHGQQEIVDYEIQHLDRPPTWAYHHPLYSPLVAARNVNQASQQNLQETKSSCIKNEVWRPLLIVLVFCLVLVGIAVTVALLLNHYVDKSDETEITDSDDPDPAKGAGKRMFRASVKFVSEDSEGPPDVEDQQIIFWLETALDRVMQASFLEDVYLYSKTTAIGQNTARTKATFSMYFDDVALYFDEDPLTIRANLLRVLRQGFSQLSRTTPPGVTVDPSTVTILS